MNCPKCGKCAKYMVPRKHKVKILGEVKMQRPPREDFRAECKSCGWKGKL